MKIVEIGTPNFPPGMQVSSEVENAVQTGRAVVALETAVVTHGLPAPHHLRAMADMASEVRSRDAVPAICLIHDGKLWVGASEKLVEELANDPRREKASVRDIGPALVRGASAGLTVSATLFAAEAVGIQAFATGGIGGIHRGYASTGDASADLRQLAQSPVVTVCSGAKSVLDIPRTLEYLETLGVPVFAYRSVDFPAFYLRSSGIQALRVDSAAEIAAVARCHWSLGLKSGIVIGHPLEDRDALLASDWNRWLLQAENAAEREGVSGKQVTPYLLNRVAEYSVGETVRANLALLTRNAALAAEIAVALVS